MLKVKHNVKKTCVMLITLGLLLALCAHEVGGMNNPKEDVQRIVNGSVTSSVWNAVENGGVSENVDPASPLPSTSSDHPGQHTVLNVGTNLSTVVQTSEVESQSSRDGDTNTDNSPPRLVSEQHSDENSVRPSEALRCSDPPNVSFPPQNQQESHPSDDGNTNASPPPLPSDQHLDENSERLTVAVQCSDAPNASSTLQNHQQESHPSDDGNTNSSVSEDSNRARDVDLSSPLPSPSSDHPGQHTVLNEGTNLSTDVQTSEVESQSSSDGNTNTDNSPPQLVSDQHSDENSVRPSEALRCSDPLNVSFPPQNQQESHPSDDGNTNSSVSEDSNRARICSAVQCAHCRGQPQGRLLYIIASDNGRGEHLGMAVCCSENCAELERRGNTVIAVRLLSDNGSIQQMCAICTNDKIKFPLIICSRCKNFMCAIDAARTYTYVSKKGHGWKCPFCRGFLTRDTCTCQLLIPPECLWRPANMEESILRDEVSFQFRDSSSEQNLLHEGVRDSTDHAYRQQVMEHRRQAQQRENEMLEEHNALQELAADDFQEGPVEPAEVEDLPRELSGTAMARDPDLPVSTWNSDVPCHQFLPMVNHHYESLPSMFEDDSEDIHNGIYQGRDERQQVMEHRRQAQEREDEMLQEHNALQDLADDALQVNRVEPAEEGGSNLAIAMHLADNHTEPEVQDLQVLTAMTNRVLEEHSSRVDESEEDRFQGTEAVEDVDISPTPQATVRMFGEQVRELAVCYLSQLLGPPQ